jgi:outer membrane protein
MRLRAIMTFAWILSVPVSSGWGQDEVMTLTLEQSVAIALERNPEVRIAEKERDKARAAIREAYATLLPTIDASVSFQKAWHTQETTVPNFIKTMLGSGFPGTDDMPDYVQFSFALENTFTYGATLSQPLFLGGAGIAGIQMAAAARRASEHALDARRQALVYRTASAFYGCLLARELVEVQEKALSHATANLDLVQKKYDAGSASGFDRMRAEVEVANLRPEIIAARNTYRAALTGLRSILGLDKECPIAVEGALTFAADDMEQIDFQEYSRLVRQNRPELFALDARRTVAAKGVTLARSRFLPKLFFTTDYSFLAMRDDYDFVRDDFSKGFSSALSLQIPIFHGFRSSSQYEQARLDYRMALDAEDQVRDGIAAEAELAYDKFFETREKYESAKESIALASEALRLADLMYEEGVTTQLDVLGSQLALTRARLNHATALYEYQMARYELRRVAGLLEGAL